jgi:hypothetical protein
MIRTVALMIKVQRTVAAGSESFMAAPKAKAAKDLSEAAIARDLPARLWLSGFCIIRPAMVLDMF